MNIANSPNIYKQKDYSNDERINNIKEFLDPKFMLVEVLTIETNCEITSVQIDLSKSLILINSTDKYLRYYILKSY